MPFPAAILPLATSLFSKLGSIFNRGHADDQVGEADGVLMGEICIPIIREITGITAQPTWMSVDPATNEVAYAEEQHRWPLTASRTAELIAWGDAALAQGCAAMSKAGYPCRPYVAGKTGAGTLPYTKWNRLKSYMVIGLDQATKREQGAALQLGSQNILSSSPNANTPLVNAIPLVSTAQGGLVVGSSVFSWQKVGFVLVGMGALAYFAFRK